MNLPGAARAEEDEGGESAPDDEGGAPEAEGGGEEGGGGEAVGVDSHGDGVSDADDLCVDNPYKSAPGDCGCLSTDADANSDGTLDCFSLHQTVTFTASVPSGTCAGDPSELTVTFRWLLDLGLGLSSGSAELNTWSRTSPPDEGAIVATVDYASDLSFGHGRVDALDYLFLDDYEIPPDEITFTGSTDDGREVQVRMVSEYFEVFELLGWTSDRASLSHDVHSGFFPYATLQLSLGSTCTTEGVITSMTTSRGFLDDDGDGFTNDVDQCPDEPASGGNLPGCPAAAADTDFDGVPDSEDLCPTDHAKSEPGECGCHNSDIDSDTDGVPDCLDRCSGENATSHDLDADGCLDDADGDHVPDVEDRCEGYHDFVDPDGDGIPSGCDVCPYDARMTWTRTGSATTRTTAKACSTATNSTATATASATLASPPTRPPPPPPRPPPPPPPPPPRSTPTGTARAMSSIPTTTTTACST